MSKDMKNKFKILGFVLFILAVFFSVIIIGLNRGPLFINKGGKLSVVTTLFPLYDLTKEVGQEKVDVLLLLPPGVEPHAFEPKPKDIVTINNADVFVYTGDFMEVWAEDILDGVANSALLPIAASDGVDLMESEHMDEEHQEQEDDHRQDETFDPHIWLDFEDAQKIVDNIALGLSKKDPVNKDYYLANAQDYKEKLRRLDSDYKTGLKSCRVRKIVFGGHYSFGYLADRYNLDYLPAIKGFEPDSEPSANELTQLAKAVKDLVIKYIFFEELSSPKIAQTIADETQAKLLLLNAAHNVSKEDLDQGVNFLSIMRTNLDNLKEGLECK